MPLRMNLNVNQTPRTLGLDPTKKNCYKPAIVSRSGIKHVEKKDAANVISNTRNSSSSDTVSEKHNLTSGHIKRNLNSDKFNCIPQNSRKILAPSVVKTRRSQPPDFMKKSKVVHPSKKDQNKALEIAEPISVHFSSKENTMSASVEFTNSVKEQKSSSQAVPPSAPGHSKDLSEISSDNSKIRNSKDTLAKVSKKQPMALVRSFSANPNLKKIGKGVDPTEAGRCMGDTIFHDTPSIIPDYTATNMEQIEEMEAVIDYIEHISDALAHRTRGLPPPAHLDTFRATIVPKSRCKPLNVEKNLGNHTSNVLSNLQEAATMFLSWFSKVEYLNLSQNESLRNLELQTLNCGARVLGLVEAVERNFLTHELSVVREAFFSNGGYLAVTECRELIDAMTQTTQHILLLRQLVHERDLFRVLDLFEVHKDSIKKRLENASSRRSVQFQKEMIKGPFFSWLERRWLPAMRSWRRIILEARQLSISGNVQAALAHSQKEAFGVEALHDILRSGETIQDLHKTQIEIPIVELAEVLKKKEEAMNSLRAVMQRSKMTSNTDAADPRSFEYIAELEKAIKSCRDVLDLGNFRESVDEQIGQVLSEAEQLLLDMQEIEKTRQALTMELTTKGSSGGVQLFLQIHEANELIHRLHLPENASNAQNVVSSCRAAVAKFVEADTSSNKDKYRNRHSTQHTGLVELLPPNMTIHEVALPHMPSHLWSKSMVTLYKQACLRLIELFTHELVCRGLERTLGDINTTFLSSMSEDTNASNPTVLHNANGDDAGSVITDCTIRKYENSHQSVPSEQSTFGFPEAQLRHSEKSILSGQVPSEMQASLERQLTLKLKVHFEAQMRIVHVHKADTTFFDDVFRRLYKQCCELFTIMHRSQSSSPPDPNRLRIRYQDTDGDFITLLNDEDWHVMLGELNFGLNPRRSSDGDTSCTIPTKLDIYCDFILLPEDNTTDSVQVGASLLGKEKETTMVCAGTVDMGDEITDTNDGSVTCAPSNHLIFSKKQAKIPHESPAMMRLEALKRTLLLNSTEKNPPQNRKDRKLFRPGRSQSAQPNSNRSRHHEHSGRKASMLLSLEPENNDSPISFNKVAKNTLQNLTPTQGFPLTVENLAQHHDETAILKEKVLFDDTPSKAEGSVEKDTTPLVHHDHSDFDKISPRQSSIKLNLHTNKRWDQEGEDEMVLEMETAASMLTCTTNRSTVVLNRLATEVITRGACLFRDVEPPRSLTPLPTNEAHLAVGSSGEKGEREGESKMINPQGGVEGRRVAPSTRPPLPNPCLRHASPLSRYAQHRPNSSDDETRVHSPKTLMARHRDPDEVLQEMSAMREENQRALYGRKLMWQHERM
ncbi:unnamed protein product [Phytomonas sp. Hart1]|nr:unnamed protein product [Phytomonas sp. Hart1]|eukprot:CCW70354.1 unnamed protein product [Phytomonas sp. isolate Hart1]